MITERCPACDEEVETSVVVATTTPESHAEQHADLFASFDGVADTDWRVDDGDAIVTLTIDDDAYATPNHFYNRDAFDSDATPHIDVIDVEPGIVELRHTERKEVPADHCPECGHVWARWYDLDPDIDYRIYRPGWSPA